MKSLRPLVWLLALLVIGLVSVSAETDRYLLTSVDKKIQTENWFLDHRDVPITNAQPWTIRKSTLHGGKQEGVEIIEVHNGLLRLVIVPTRGMSIYEVQLDDIRLGWDSPVKELVHPHHIKLQSRSGLGWLEGFNEWMVRCGLESAGHPGQDKFINNVGDEATMDLTLHGKIGNIPASEVEVLVDTKPPGRIHIRGRVDERMFYGPQLELWTEISTEIGSSEFTISDTVTNRGGAEQEFQLIYHGNFGPSLLEEGSQLVAPIRQVSPFNEHAAKSINSHRTYAAPTEGFIEQVYCIKPYSDPLGKTMALLHNADQTRGVSLEYSTKDLPFLTQWKNTSDLKSGYVTGIEPGTGFPYNRRVERHYDRVPSLSPTEARHFQLRFKILTNNGTITETIQKINEIQNGRPTEIKPVPEADLSLFN